MSSLRRPALLPSPGGALEGILKGLDGQWHPYQAPE